MIKKIIQSTILCVFATLYMQAQNEPQYTQYMFNISSFNPAYIGTTQDVELTLLHRSQWVGIPGAPNTQNFSLNYPLGNEKMGLGLQILRDEIGPATQTFFNASYAYILQASDDVKWSFGLDAGGSMLNIDLSKGDFENPNDPAANLMPGNTFYPTIGAGTFVYSDNWYFGLSVPNFLSTDSFDEEVATVVDDNLQFNLIGGYVFDLSSNLKFKPAFMAHFLKGAPVTFNVSANFLISEKIMAGASYRYENAVTGLIGFQISKGMFLGYSYDYTTNPLSDYNSGSHEAILKFTFGKSTSKRAKGDPKQINTPRFF